MAFDCEKFIAQSTRDLEALEGRALLAASGGVDSTVACVIVHKVFGSRLKSVFVDTGLLRKGEVEEVVSKFKALGIPLKVVDARAKFLKALKGLTDPELKRKAIGKSFIEVFEVEAKEFKANYLVQGTIAPDWIESGSGIRATIKSHHNVGGLPEKMKLKLIEPVRDLYKDEVRKLASFVEMKRDSYWKQPFPGPGLAIRVLGEVTAEKVALCREVNAIVCDEVYSAFEKSEIKELPWQYFAVLLDSKSVGVQGDLRAYGYTVAVRAVEATDGLTANYSLLPPELLQRISIRITNEFKQVNRVVYDITNKPPGTIEWL